MFLNNAVVHSRRGAAAEECPETQPARSEDSRAAPTPRRCFLSRRVVLEVSLRLNSATAGRDEMTFSPRVCYTSGRTGRLAQLARARRSHRRGHWFEISIAEHPQSELILCLERRDVADILPERLGLEHPPHNLTRSSLRQLCHERQVV